jgi:predicted ArsR family transcriptional regulator
VGGDEVVKPDITASYHKGNPASVAAHASVTPEDRRKPRTRVYRFIFSQGLHGATSDEAEQALGLTHQACSARFTELKRDDLIVDVGRRKTRSGRSAFVYAIQVPF